MSIDFAFTDWSATVTLTISVWVVAFLGIAGALFWYISRRPGHYEVAELTLEIPGTGTVSLKPNREISRIAYAAWVELNTRKAALPFDTEHDVIVEVYDSWYQLFSVLRSLAKDVPAYQVRTSPGTRRLVDTMMLVLNQAMRPHLTRWQARFRSWFAEAVKRNPALSPQEVQRTFPELDELTKDLERVNRQLRLYSDWLRVLAFGPAPK